MEKLNITFCSFPDYGGNAKVLYEYMKDKYDFNMVWIVYNEENHKKLLENGVKAILIGTDEFKEYIKTTDVFFTTQGNLDGDKTDKSLYIELWHGVGPKPVGYMCNNPSQEDIRGYNNMRKIFDYIIVPNDFWKVIFAATFHVEANRVKSLGLPILDYFINSPGKSNLAKVLNTDVTKYEKIIFYMPTYKSGFNHNDVEKLNLNNIFNFDEYDENVLNDFLVKNNYLLCVKRHPGETNTFKDIETSNIRKITEDALINNNVSINEIINACDLMISDYSSIITEFIFLNRPVLYAVGDLEEYEEKRGIIFSNFDFWTVGPKCRHIEELITESKRLLTDSSYYKKERDKISKLWYGNVNSGGCKELCDFLFDENGIKKDVVYYKSSELALEKKVVEKTEELNQKLSDLQGKTKEFDLLINSKGWKALEKLRKIKRKIFKRNKN